jgi:Tfp pilus assembly PilM family ATPase
MSRLSFSLHEAPAPPAAIGISASRVSGIALEERGGRPTIAAHAFAPLPEHAVVPALNALNVRDQKALASAIAQVLDRIGRPRRVALVVDDPVAKVSLVRLQQVPSRTQDLDQVIRWQVRKSAPFAIEDAQVSYANGLLTPDGQEFIVTMARRDVIAEHEALCAEAGADAGLVDISTFNVVNAVLVGTPPAGDWLLVNMAPGWESIAIMRGSELIFFRNRGADGEGTMADLVHQTAMYYEDRLGGGGFGRVLLCGAAVAGEGDLLRRNLAERLSARVDTVDPTQAAALADRIAGDGVLLDTLAPLVGVLLRSREAA